MTTHTELRTTVNVNAYRALALSTNVMRAVGLVRAPAVSLCIQTRPGSVELCVCGAVRRGSDNDEDGRHHVDCVTVLPRRYSI